MNATLAAVRARVADQGEAANCEDRPVVTPARRHPANPSLLDHAD